MTNRDELIAENLKLKEAVRILGESDSKKIQTIQHGRLAGSPGKTGEWANYASYAGSSAAHKRKRIDCPFKSMRKLKSQGYSLDSATDEDHPHRGSVGNPPKTRGFTISMKHPKGHKVHLHHNSDEQEYVDKHFKGKTPNVEWSANMATCSHDDHQHVKDHV